MIFGLTAGISPGPLLTLVISETLQYNRIAGIKVAVAPLITDGPILLISLFVLSKIANLNALFGAISLVGAGFLAYLAYESLTIRKVDFHIQRKESASLKRGIITNALSPHPYLFYLTVGGPLLVKALHQNVIFGVTFIVSFLIFLVGSKITIAMIVEKSRLFLKSRTYIYTIKMLGIILLVFALLFLKDAYAFFMIPS